MGLKAGGRQPDIVLAFWFEDDPHHNVVFALADAKRNATDDGKSYLVKSLEAMTVYQVAFSRALRLKIDNSGEFIGPINPSITIFAWQRVAKVCGIQSEDQDSLVQRFKNEEPMPSIIAFDMTHYGYRGDPWSAPVLAAWFERLVHQAAQELRAPYLSLVEN